MIELITKFYKFITNHWTHTLATLILVGILTYAHGCQPQVPSLLEPAKKVSRAQLQIELKTIIATSEMHFRDLDRQEQIRKMILQNALVLAQGKPFNPIGLITSIAAMYGLGSVANDTKNLIKKKKATT